MVLLTVSLVVYSDSLEYSSKTISFNQLAVYEAFCIVKQHFHTPKIALCSTGKRFVGVGCFMFGICFKCDSEGFLVARNPGERINNATPVRLLLS